MENLQINNIEQLSESQLNDLINQLNNNTSQRIQNKNIEMLDILKRQSFVEKLIDLYVTKFKPEWKEILN